MLPPRTNPRTKPGFVPAFLGLLAGCALVLTGCQEGGNFTLFGYTTQPQYNCHLHTVYVPIFKNLTMYKRLEFELTEAVIREIEAKTPYKVVSCPTHADTELTGTIISYNKGMINMNQLNEVREAQTTLGVEVVWRDLHTGEILSRPKAPGTAPPTIPGMPAPIFPGEPVAPLPVAPPGGPPPPAPNQGPPVLVQSLGDFIPELGQSLATARQQNVDYLATQIVSMMEQPW